MPLGESHTQSAENCREQYYVSKMRSLFVDVHHSVFFIFCCAPIVMYVLFPESSEAVDNGKNMVWFWLLSPVLIGFYLMRKNRIPNTIRAIEFDPISKEITVCYLSRYETYREDEITSVYYDEMFYFHFDLADGRRIRIKGLNTQKFSKTFEAWIRTKWTGGGW